MHSPGISDESSDLRAIFQWIWQIILHKDAFKELYLLYQLDFISMLFTEFYSAGDSQITRLSLEERADWSPINQYAGKSTGKWLFNGWKCVWTLFVSTVTQGVGENSEERADF